jgi:hypothetical protein
MSLVRFIRCIILKQDENQVCLAKNEWPAFLATLQLLVTWPAVISITCLFFSKKKNQSQLLVFDLNLGVLGHPSQARALDFLFLYFYIFF